MLHTHVTRIPFLSQKNQTYYQSESISLFKKIVLSFFVTPFFSFYIYYYLITITITTTATTNDKNMNKNKTASMSVSTKDAILFIICGLTSEMFIDFIQNVAMVKFMDIPNNSMNHWFLPLRLVLWSVF